MSNKFVQNRLVLGIRFFLVLGVLCILGGRAAVTAAADDNWRARYWNNKSLAGDPVVDRQEKSIDHDWGDGRPDSAVSRDGFSGRWTRVLNFAAGTYRFTATMDDGMRIWIDDTLILDSWQDSQVRTQTVTTPVSAGEHRVKVEYYENTGQAVAKLVIEPLATDITRWRGEYFNNRSLSGSPAVVRDDQNIDFNWGGGSPASGISADNFSVRWTRNIGLEPGRYRFTTTTDDGVRLWVGGRLLIDKWFDQAPTMHSAELDLPGGQTEVRMEYYDGEGGASARLERTQVTAAGGDDRWRGEYFNNKNLSGSPQLVRNDDHIAFNWGNGSPGPGINKDDFSVRWTRTLNLSPGTYRFTANTDDGVRLWVNGQQIINAWSDHKPQDYVGDVSLPGGPVEVRMEYYENAGGARANLSRSQISGSPGPSPTPVPAPSQPTAVVPGVRLNFRQGPGPTYAILQVLGQGDVVTLVARSDAATWALVQAPNGARGWVYAPLLQTAYPISSLPPASGGVPDPAGSGPTATVSNAVYALNVRSGPGVTFETLGTIVRGQRVEVIGRNAAGTWIKLRMADGRQGWSSAQYLISNTSFSSLPVVN